MADHSNQNAMPHSIPGGTIELFNGAGASKGNYVFRNLNTNRPKKIIDNPDEYGTEGSDPTWADVGFDFQTGSITISIRKNPMADAANPQWPNSDCATNGDWYFQGNFGFGNERWTLTSATQPFVAGQDWTGTFEVKRSKYIAP